MKTFLIGGTIIDDSAQAWAFEDVTPSQVRATLAKLEPNEDITFEISSPGGSVTAGIAIANLIRQASKDGHPCKCHIVGIAASMASVIACACDEVEMDESAFMMIHNPWTVAQGDADDLRKSADVLDQMKNAILSFYRSKFDKTDDELKALMDAETWFTGAEAESFGFKAIVKKCESELKAAACAREIPGFAAMPETAKHLFVLGQHDEPKAEEPVVETAPAVEAEPVVETEPVETPAAEPAPVEEAPAAPAEAPAEAPAPVETPAAEPVAEAKADPFTERLAKAMKSRDAEINSLKAKIGELEAVGIVDADALLAKNAEIEDFKNQLEIKGKELMEAKAEVTRLAGELEKAKSELTETSSALDAKVNALAELNARVLTAKDVVVERSFDEIINDPKATPREKLEASRKETARRNRKN